MSDATLLLIFIGASALAAVAAVLFDTLRGVGDEALSAELDALQPNYQMADLRAPEPVPAPPGRLPRVVMPNIFEQLCQEMGTP